MRNNEGSVLYLLLVLILCAEVCMTNARHLIKKRNYSDQSVRGYLAESEKIQRMHVIDANEIYEISNKWNTLSGLVGGTRSAKKNFTANSAAVVQDGPIVVLLADITTLIVV
ncbi:uncharacterized protein LOC126926215 isoform X1 [Bombus affinis]|uniref:Uncharacterized protein LOC100649519 isoform X1 n=1 Tax=Bombus terrestris TaxID=30195 RepID=A0A9C6W2L7_BOMTE|nr:uncharacterized protein LOC100649519 isoform X1 [Bombus terrestris]XP_050598374.1 uncharacterized protein LOC126926215 isoform X1 [Bombus affinis]